ncbi:hypothetical protein ES319_D03G069000v1 [Gossypium barbadense]|uniref:VWFA domain-containing protein n=1 Tax=Gossypium barbadense TaxID=3634 RepID=A0A5J5S145_GOSBA|nr:hypothetical protein ES319_D03G069000v1 [Gossypium barbadense]
MVLEATMICIDNSEWMRNDDYSLSRFQAQADAVSLICGAKTESNPKNTMGILTMSCLETIRTLEVPNLYHDLCKACSSVRNPCLITSVKDEQLFIRCSLSFLCKSSILRFSFEMIGKCLMWVVGAELIIAGLYLVILGKSEESKYLSENEPIYSVSENNDMESTFVRPLLENKLQS